MCNTHFWTVAEAYYWQKFGQIQRHELLPQFVTDFHEIWHRCLPGDVYVQDTLFDSSRNCVTMVTAYYGQEMGENLAL